MLSLSSRLQQTRYPLFLLKITFGYQLQGGGTICDFVFRLAIHKALGVDRTSSEEIKEAVTEIDTDGDGAIDLHEFVDFHCATAALTATANEEAERRSATRSSCTIKLYDRDKNGLISAQKISDAFEMYDREMYGWLI
ncbi:hypothetical protein Vadar_006269 [Vaccinium darrowii]|uniref:Uncharacterized protein n=1 Tax=Vaccinium darrowii TaxID=229202 RepID=A0ACB7Z9W5_9ERIC|nr:hypothetical protein Vadar_006269 [Vaccinium darrowii]